MAGAREERARGAFWVGRCICKWSGRAIHGASAPATPARAEFLPHVDRQSYVRSLSRQTIPVNRARRAGRATLIRPKRRATAMPRASRTTCRCTVGGSGHPFEVLLGGAVEDHSPHQWPDPSRSVIEEE